MIINRRLCALAGLLLMPLADVALAAPFSFDSAPGRLPKDVVPVDYTITVRPDLKTLTIDGTESVLLDVRSPVTSITFNSLNERLRNVRLDGRPAARVVSDDTTQLTTVTLPAPVGAGQHTLTFAYKGKIEHQPQGLFAQEYHDVSGKPAVLLSTQMEATDARRMFPCWDEPSFRATFALTAIVPAAWTAVSNMPIAKRVVRGKTATTSFDRSPKMPSYLVELSAGDLASISSSHDGIALSVVAVRGREHEGETALANAAQILSDYNDYFAYRYPLPKLDSIAVPGGFQGAMENWGAITYNDQTLLLNPASTTGQRQGVYSIQAHEMAHQWFGDLVTMAWWDEIWLNESFASWMAAKQTAQRNPEWNWWEGEDSTKEVAMTADARVTSHAIERHVTDELQATNAFDPEITYNKGQSVLRMFEAYLGPVVFRDGVRAYMHSRAMSNATGTDLWNALGAASHQDVAALATGWTTQPGFPLVTVSAQCDQDGARTISMSQKRFVPDGSVPGPEHWSVPLQVRDGASSRPTSVLLSIDGQTLAAGRCDAPLSINADAIGYFRTVYDAGTLANNTRLFAQLPSGDRIALLDDQWALVEAGAAPLTSYLSLAQAMGASLESRPWEQVTGALETIERSMRDSPKYAAFTTYARAILNVPFALLGWNPQRNETPDRRRLRRNLIEDLGAWGDPAVLAEARARFDAFTKNHDAIAPDDQGMILRTVALSADPATFDALHAVARAFKGQAELDRYYGALMSVRDPALAARAADIALSAEIPAEADSERLNLVARLADWNPRLSFSVLQANYDRLLAPQATFASLVAAQYLPQIYGRGIPLEEIEAYVRTKVPPEMAAEIGRGKEAAQLGLTHQALLRTQAQTILP